MSSRNRMTLLEMVQGCLGSMTHDSVNSISATVESRQLAEEARVTYYELMDRDDWPHLMQHLQLEGIADGTRPNFLRIPKDVVRIDDLRYESTTDVVPERRFNKVMYLHPTEFLDLVLGRRSTDENTITVKNHNNIDMFVLTNKAPEYWTSFDDEHIVFDSYDSSRETTMHANKSLILAKVIPAWESRDGFIPDMPDHMFSTYFAEFKASSFLYWKQGGSAKDEQRAARGISRLRHDARKIDEYREKARYGRIRSGYANTSRDGTIGSIYHANT